jgi:hypothetical protein
VRADACVSTRERWGHAGMWTCGHAGVWGMRACGLAAGSSKHRVNTHEDLRRIVRSPVGLKPMRGMPTLARIHYNLSYMKY